MRQNGTLYYILEDHLGSTSIVTDAAGTVISQTRYKIGAERTDVTSPSPAGTDYGYTGQRELDPGMGGLMDYKARFYSVYLNRFVQPDSIVPNMFYSQNLNRYAYVNNSPMNYTDPSGHICVESDGDSDVGMAGNCHGKSNPNYKSGLQGPKWRDKQKNEKANHDNPCLTVLCKASEGDLLATGELILPSHFGLGVQFSFALGFGEFLGAGFELSANAIYYWQSDQLIVTIDGGPNGGVGVKVPVPIETSLTSGPLVGWGQSSATAGNSSIGLGVSASAIEAGTISVSAPATIGLNGVEFYEDPHYGVIPATAYAGIGVGCCGAGVSGLVTGNIITVDASGVLPWNWR